MQIEHALVDNRHASWPGIMIEAEHMRMSMRRIRKPHSFTVTSSYSEIFREDLQSAGNSFIESQLGLIEPSPGSPRDPLRGELDGKSVMGDVLSLNPDAKPCWPVLWKMIGKLFRGK